MTATDMMKADSVQRQADGDPATAALRGAIEAKLLVSVRYNQGISILAPYATFLRHGDPYLRAVTVARDGREPSRLKLGTFKLSGLSDLHVTPVPFSPSALYRRIEGYKANG